MRYLDDVHHELNSIDLGLRQTAEGRESIDWQPLEHGPAVPVVLGPWTRRVVIATALWAVLELPLEIWVSTSTEDVVACITAKVLWVVLVGLVLMGSRTARTAYAFLCTLGLIAVAFGLPDEYRVFPMGFMLSLIECLLKSVAFVCLVSTRIDPDDD